MGIISKPNFNMIRELVNASESLYNADQNTKGIETLHILADKLKEIKST
jgi:hypothetical protein